MNDKHLVSIINHKSNASVIDAEVFVGVLEDQTVVEGVGGGGGGGGAQFGEPSVSYFDCSSGWGRQNIC